jgi:hypothetical protein
MESKHVGRRREGEKQFLSDSNFTLSKSLTKNEYATLPAKFIDF